MNAIVPIGASGIVPQGFDDALRLAKAMSTIKELPKHLNDSVGTCLMVVDQAMRWRMSPFAVAQHSFNIGGKMGYEGKIMAAAVESMGAIVGGFDYRFAGEGDNRTVTVSAVRAGETEPRQMTIRLGDVKTSNEMWKKQPDQQLVYSGSRNWARRWTPAALLGAYAREEFDHDMPAREPPHNGPTLEHEATPPKPEPETRREAINRETPLHPTPPPERTPAELMDGLEIAVRDAGSQVAFTRLVGQRRVQDMLRDYKGDDLARLQGIVAAGNAAYATVVHPDAESDIWGDAPVTEGVGAG